MRLVLRLGRAAAAAPAASRLHRKHADVLPRRVFVAGCLPPNRRGAEPRTPQAFVQSGVVPVPTPAAARLREETDGRETTFDALRIRRGFVARTKRFFALFHVVVVAVAAARRMNSKTIEAAKRRGTSRGPARPPRRTPGRTRRRRPTARSKAASAPRATSPARTRRREVFLVRLFLSRPRGSPRRSPCVVRVRRRLPRAPPRSPRRGSMRAAPRHFRARSPSRTSARQVSSSWRSAPSTPCPRRAPGRARWGANTGRLA